MINKSASKIGTIELTNGNRVTFHIGHNHNTGDTIVWQVVKYTSGTLGRSVRTTGKNIAKLAREVVACNAKWVGERNEAAYAAFVNGA